MKTEKKGNENTKGQMDKGCTNNPKCEGMMGPKAGKEYLGHFGKESVMRKGHNASGSAKWIQGAIKHPGALHRELGVPEGQNIPAGKLAKAAKAGGTLGRRARLAQTLKAMH